MKIYSDVFDLFSSIKNFKNYCFQYRQKCPSFMVWNSLIRWSRQRVVNSTIINSEKIKKLASLTPVKLNGDPLILKEFAILLAICQISKMLLDEFYSYQNTEITISEWVKSNRNSLGLNQEAACNTLNSREIISDFIL
ncbi:hypothetical protein T12_1219 [Trichinella patagoniensis]|uniref:Uncharacterized protein n=1 Tax=Trichinella patagoniensis TaxID=990121 RepID=A0A0V0ZNN3_9BILA|nr:hypothetical protein T12_1219 [Trichinella patagoniensis]